MKTIKCSCGQDILLDDEDYDRVSKEQLSCTGKLIQCGTGWNKFPLSSFIKPHDKHQMDHVDRNNHNNQKHNLRPASTAENCRNQGPRKTNKTGYKGVSKNPSKYGKPWRAQICVNYKVIFLGTFDTIEEAALTYNNAAKRYHGEFAYENVLSTTTV